MPLSFVAILAVVQGLTEFLPVSSKTHLLFARHFLGRGPDLFFDITLHVGSLLAILVYYRRRWAELFRERRSEVGRLAIGSVPAVVAAVLFKSRIEALYTDLRVASGLLLVTGFFLWTAERLGRERFALAETPWGRVLWIGAAQACALLPGISRSGSTIGAGFLAGLHREEAVRFSFFLGAVAIAGALVFKGRDALRAEGDIHALPILLGVAITFVVSLLAIRAVEILSLKGRLSLFAAYCAAAGAAGLVLFARG
jgi:undecaprenyl-diphosphatase